METIANSAKLINSQYGEDCKFYNDSVVKNSHLGNTNSIGNDTNIVNCQFEDNVIINRRNYVNDSIIGRFTYTGLNCTINFAKIGRFCSIARNVDIGGFDHRYDCVSTMPIFRLNNLMGEAVELKDKELCEISNDVWIAAGTNILHKCKIGNGAVIGAGAVVTKDVEPYTIVAGIPARPMKKRFSDEIIAALEEIQWWNWPIEIINEHRNLLFGRQVDAEVLKEMYKIANSL